MPTADESHARLEEKVAAASMSIYRVDFLCPACGKWHGACPHFQFQGGPNSAGFVADLFARQPLPDAVQRELHSSIVCTTTGALVSMNDPSRVYLTPSTGI
ncbi:MAG: hypothetical protein AB8I69_07935 [Anaerolineae bacterium]